MIIDTYAALGAFLRDLAQQRAVAFDTETSGLRIWHGDAICGLAFAFEDGRTFYIPVRHRVSVPEVVFEKQGRRKVRVETGNWLEREFRQLPPEVTGRIFDVIAMHDIVLRTHNGKFDLHMVANEGIDVSNIKVYDTYVMSKLYNNIEESNRLKVLGKKYIDPDARDEELELERLLIERGWQYRDPVTGEKIKHMDWLTPQEIAAYAEKDTALTNALYHFYRRELSKMNCLPVLERESEFLHVVLEMERTGWRVDLDYCQRALEEIVPRIAEVQESIYSLVGYEFNIGSALELGKAMKKLGVRSEITTEKGAESWAKAALLKNNHPVVDLVLEHRELSKLRSTYLDNFMKLCDADGVIHPSIEQCEAKTGRTSSREPNIQNVTGRAKRGWELRNCFLPRPGHVLVLVDWRQMELRIMAHMANEQVLKDAIARGDDLHLLTAIRIAEELGEEVCGDPECPEMQYRRKLAKTIVFGLMYGMGVEKLAHSLGIPEERAVKMRDAFWASYPAVHKWAKSTRKMAGDLGFAANFYGRWYRYPPSRDPSRREAFAYGHAAVDHRVQGTGADMMKLAMNRIRKGLRQAKMKTRLLSVIHDEIIAECPVDEVERYIRNAIRVMCDFPEFTVPIEVEVCIATESWSKKEVYHAQAA